MGKNLEETVEIVRRGIKEELEAALNYTQLSGRQGDWELRKVMVNYAIEELEHAKKLINILEKLDQPVGDLAPQLGDNDDLIVALIEYLAKEESAIFYYDALKQLINDEEVKRISKKIQDEEKRHQHYMQEVLNKIKTGEYQYD